MKRLSTQKWVDFIKHESNPSQTWTRIRGKADRAIDHLTLLARTMPEERQKEIFDERKIFNLMWSVISARNPFQLEEGLGPRSPFDGRRTTLASTLVMVGISVCKSKYNSLMKDTPDLSKPIVSHLEQSVAICRDIAYRSELMERDTEAEKQAMVYLFEWKKMTSIATKHYKRRFEQFIREEAVGDYADIEFGPIKLSKNGKKIQGTFTFENGCSWSFVFELHEDDDETNVGFKVFDENGTERASKNLIAKKEGDSIYVYEKKKK